MSDQEKRIQEIIDDLKRSTSRSCLERTERMRKLDIAFAVALILVVVLFGVGLLAVQRSRNVIYYSHQTAIPLPEWTRYAEAEVSA